LSDTQTAKEEFPVFEGYKDWGDDSTEETTEYIKSKSPITPQHVTSIRTKKIPETRNRIREAMIRMQAAIPPKGIKIIDKTSSSELTFHQLLNLIIIPAGETEDDDPINIPPCEADNIFSIPPDEETDAFNPANNKNL